MADRGRQIERKYWGYDKKDPYEPFISHWSKKGTLDKQKNGDHPEKDNVKFFFWDGISLPLRVTHTLGFDLLFFGVIVYSIAQLIILLFN